MAQKQPAAVDAMDGGEGRDDAVPRYRSGAVARMLRMPVATLRIWERRYRVAAPATSPSGHRLYSAADVKRLALLRQLTALGHAIGSLAPLDVAALRQVASTHAGVLAGPRRAAMVSDAIPIQAAEAQLELDESDLDVAQGDESDSTPSSSVAADDEAARRADEPALPAADSPAPAPAPAVFRAEAAPAAVAQPQGADAAEARTAPVPVAVAADADAVGPARPVGVWRVSVAGSVLARRLEQPVLRDRLGRRPALVQVWETLDEALAALESGAVVPAEALLLQCATLRAADLARLQALAQASGARRVHVLYGFATSALSTAFESAGLLLLRAPQDDRALASWLQASCSPLPLPLVVAPRRWDDAALADFAGLSTTISCECPRHVAELLMQLSSFEAYSAECAHRDPADAALHGYLGQVAGTARALFEQALERLAVQDGLMLPGEGM
jgi:DNA-binding transcriptional MerR regulator